jgi:DNA-binding protein HU-beta
MATKQTLVEHLTHNCGLHRASAIQAVEGIIAKISESLTNGEDVSLRGFGTFRTYEVPERNGRNVRTGAPITIPAHTTVRFRPGAELKNKLNE